MSHAHLPAGSPGASGPRTLRLRNALIVTGTFFVVELAGGMISGSLALLADAAHMFTDVAALLLSYAAMSLAARRPTDAHTFGFYRAEILAAFVNAQLLLVMSGYIFYEAHHRWYQPPKVATGVMLWVAVAGLGANLLAMVLLRADRDASLNLKAAYLEVLSDTLGSIAVIAAALVMRPTGWYWLDPLASVGIAVLILPRTYSVLRQSVHILLEGTPPGFDVASLRDRILAIPGVDEVHDLHLWTLTSGRHSASVHVRAADDSPRGQVLRDVQQLFKDTEGMDHATVQVEWGAEVQCQTTRCDRGSVAQDAHRT